MKVKLLIVFVFALSLCLNKASGQGFQFRPTSYTAPFVSTINDAAAARAYLGVTSGNPATNLVAWSSGGTNRSFTAKGTNGASEFYVDKDANAVMTGNFTIYGYSGFTAVNGNISLHADGGVYFGGRASLTSDATGVTAQKNGTLAQTNRIYHTYTGPNDHQRLALYTTASSVNIAAETAGTGADNLNIVLLPAGTGGVVIGSAGTAITNIVSATATLNYDLSALVVEDKTVTVTGAVVGDAVIVGVPNGSVTATVQYTGWVSAANTVTIRARTSVVGEDPASGTFRATIVSH